MGQPLAVLLAETEAVWSADPLEEVWRRPGGTRESRLTDLLNWRRALPPEVAFPEFELPYKPLEHLPGGGQREDSHRLAPPLVGASEKEMLRWLGTHPLLTAEELKVLLRTQGHDAARLATALAGKGLVDCAARRLEGETSVEPRYFLTGDGLKLLAEQDGVPPRRYVRSGPVAAAVPGWSGAGRLETLLRQLDHTAGVNGFAVRLIDEARRQRLVVAEWLSASEGAERFSSGGTTHWLRPDAVLRLSCNDNPYRLYVEWDRGTMRLPEMREKLLVYHAYYGTLARAEGSCQVPLTLIVTTTTQREAGIWEALAGCGPTIRACVLTSVAPLVDRLGPLSAVWQGSGEPGRISLIHHLAPVQMGE
jgi:hypothetical protein